ncbi:hypothetical protein NUW54_g54 [Trametes sanguinea]|uniref:Uncharacterized protein n=2 Tax=Trametes sanguinea TaxID=158606 RepID=A0ACC1MNR9_9APHY|nr:hypothetical protein NUW54_g13151 [Trametes sanguinea]KAJ3019548.1 hypothetical protein NUW54_g54 [Trametes sanguinea]
MATAVDLLKPTTGFDGFAGSTELESTDDAVRRAQERGTDADSWRTQAKRRERRRRLAGNADEAQVSQMQTQR